MANKNKRNKIKHTSAQKSSPYRPCGSRDFQQDERLGTRCTSNKQKQIVACESTDRGVSSRGSRVRTKVYRSMTLGVKGF